MKCKNSMYIALGSLGILLIPLIAMQFTNEVNWDETDFIVMGLLLFGTGSAIDVATRNVRTSGRKVIIAAVIVLAFLLLWAELAVGVFGTPFAGS